MARERMKAAQPAEVRPADGAAVSDFSAGLTGEEISPPSVPAQPMKRGAKKRAGISPTQTSDVGTQQPAKSRQRKTSNEVLPASAPAGGFGEPTQCLHVQARESGVLLEALVKQLRRELEARQGIDREAETHRQRSQAADEQLLRDAEEARRLHQNLLNEAKEARTAHQQLLTLTREGVKQVERELSSTAAHSKATSQEVEKLRKESREAYDHLLHDAKEGAALLKRESVATAGLLAEAGTEFATARGQFQGFEQEISRLHQSVRDAGQSMQDSARQAEEIRLRRAQAQEELRAFEESARVARQQREAMEHETREARERLQALREETTDAEHQLAALRQELAKSRPHREPTKHDLDHPIEETHNHLGITVDPGVVVAEVAPGTLAATAGLIPGDVIQSVNGIPILTGPELRDALLDAHEGEEIVLNFTRGGLNSEARVRFEAGDEKPTEERNHLGATVERGVVVAEVTPGTPGATVGLMRGDIITAINGKEIHTGMQLRHAVQSLESHAEVTVHFTRGRQSHDAKTRLEEVPVMS